MEQFDVLVVGSGGAGMRAALEVGRRKGLKVALITKIFPTRSATAMAQGGVNACLNNVAAEDTVEMRKARPLTDKWTFSTNGVSIMGRNGIPCIGFGPGAEAQAHAPNEITWKQDLVTCAAVYALLPSVYCKD